MTSKKLKQPTVNTSKLVYIGPTLSESRLIHATVFIGGYPLHILELLNSNPWMKQLFVPVSEMNSAIAATKEKGTIYNILYQKAKEV